MLVPVRVFDQAMGIISIDREKTSCFSDEAQNVAEALSEQISYAFVHPRARNLIESIPDRVNALLLSWRTEETLPALGPTPSPPSGDSGQPQG
jgi:hypothetical protein